jgi:hypothetical protein
MKGLCVAAPTEPLLEKAHRAVVPAVADIDRISHFFVVKRGKVLENSGLSKKKPRGKSKMWRLLRKVFTPIDL